MGQRTQILLKLVDYKGNVKLKGVHLQWGFGKVMPLHVMNMIINRECNTQYGTEFFDMYNLGGTDLAEEFTEYAPNVKDIDVENLNDVRASFFDWQDNNNGGCVVEVRQTQERSYGISSGEEIRMGFLGGGEDFDESAFTYYMSARDYMKTFERYCPEVFIKSFEGFCKYYDVKPLYKVEKKTRKSKKELVQV